MENYTTDGRPPGIAARRGAGDCRPKGAHVRGGADAPSRPARWPSLLTACTNAWTRRASAPCSAPRSMSTWESPGTARLRRGDAEGALCGEQQGAEAIMDLSSHGNTSPFRQKLTAECPVMIGTVPIHDSVSTTSGTWPPSGAKDCRCGPPPCPGRRGTSSPSLRHHPQDHRSDPPAQAEDEHRLWASFLVFAWMHMTGGESFYSSTTRSWISAGVRCDHLLATPAAPARLADATDVCQIEELVRLGELTKRAGRRTRGDGGGPAMPMDQIAANMKVQQTICMGAPFYVLGPLVTDIALADHITRCHRRGHRRHERRCFPVLCHPSRAPGASQPGRCEAGHHCQQVSAHAADISIRGHPVPGTSTTRWATPAGPWTGRPSGLVPGPETAGSIWDDRSPSGEHDDTLRPCGKFCAVRSMNKALSGRGAHRHPDGLSPSEKGAGGGAPRVGAHSRTNS